MDATFVGCRSSTVMKIRNLFYTKSDKLTALFSKLFKTDERSVSQRITEWLDETRKSRRSVCSDGLCDVLNNDSGNVVYPLMTRVTNWFNFTVKRQGGKQAITNWLKSLGHTCHL